MKSAPTKPTSRQRFEVLTDPFTVVTACWVIQEKTAGKSKVCMGVQSELIFFLILTLELKETILEM